MSRGYRSKNIFYATKGSAAADLEAAEEVIIPAGGRALVPTPLQGSDLELGDNKVGLIMPRSGLAFHHGITVLNAPGVIDSDYTGTIGVILYNTSDKDFKVELGDRIAQLMVTSYNVIWGSKFGTKDRGDGGYGSTGK